MFAFSSNEYVYHGARCQIDRVDFGLKRIIVPSHSTVSNIHNCVTCVFDTQVDWRCRKSRSRQKASFSFYLMF